MALDKARGLDELVTNARAAARALGVTPSAQKDEALKRIAAALRANRQEICSANALDVEAAKADGRPAAFVDRLLLNPERVEGMARAVEEILALEDPIGEVVDHWKRPNGLLVEKVRLPLGVVLMIYESRPNVTSDAAALCLKSGNAAILRGGSEAFRSNAAIAAAIQQGLSAAKLPAAAVQLVHTTDREAMLQLLKMEGRIDLCIPRGGEGLIQFVSENARIPVVKHAKGVCHVYVHKDADLEMAARIIVNAKAQRPGTCNAAECLLVDRAVADTFLPGAAKKLVEAKVELRGCPTTVTLLRRANVPVTPAAPDDYGKEFLDFILAVRVVKDLDHALEHIAQYSSEHTEAIVTADEDAAERFTREVSSSGVVVNASTRFNDGGELGLGAEIGISTSRLHAFGPMGLRELTAQKYVVHGKGQIRT